jgi:hypothetical protein
MNKLFIGIMLLASLGVCMVAQATEKSENKKTPVTMKNFIHADSTRAFLKELSKNGNKVNTVRPEKELANTDSQDVIRMNQDTLYSRAIVDVKGGATIKIAGYEGFQNIMILDINHSEIATLMGSGEIQLDESMLTEGQHVYMIVRTGLLRNLDKKEMLKRGQDAQSKITITAKSNEPFTPTVNYDFASLDVVKQAIFKDYAKDPSQYSTRLGFGTMKDRSKKDARVVIAIGWGGLSKENASYSSFMGYGERETFTFNAPDLRYKDKGFFSFTLYTADGYIGTQNYAINSDDMVANENGTYTITIIASGEPVQKDDKNVIISPRDSRGWMGILRMYQPTDPDKNYDWNEATTKKMTELFAK